MRIHPIPFTILLCLFSVTSFSQKDTSSALHLRSGKIYSEKNITQEELAKIIGVSRQTINAMEAGKYIPSTVLALKIARYFEKKVENIFLLEDND